MKLIIEAGATKSIWTLITRSSVINQYHDQGFNISNQKIEELIIPDALIRQSEQIHELHYYGAGVLGTVHESLLTIFFRDQLSNSSLDCHVNNDMIALARAANGQDEALLAILGTGSNAAYYDGTEIKEYSQNLGYILTDEGSGHALGKQIIKNYFYQEMPEDIQEVFNQKYGLDRPSFLTELNQPNVNQAAYLASFTYLLDEVNDEHPWKQALLTSAINNFFDRKAKTLLKKYPCQRLLVTGSIAYIFRDILTEIAKEYGIKDTFAVQNPMEGLINYHQEHYD